MADMTRLDEIAKRISASRCGRCGGQKVHDFEDGAWVLDRCTECNATWFNDPPRLPEDAPFFLQIKDMEYLLNLVRRYEKAVSHSRMFMLRVRDKTTGPISVIADEARSGLERILNKGDEP